jgi:hypothetical protein
VFLLCFALRVPYTVGREPDRLDFPPAKFYRVEDANRRLREHNIANTPDYIQTGKQAAVRLSAVPELLQFVSYLSLTAVQALGIWDMRIFSSVPIGSPI